MALEQKLRDILYRVINRLMEMPKKCTIQLVHNDKPGWENSPIEPIGSGVLIELEGCYYIITAAHVVQNYALKKLRNPCKTEDEYDDPNEAFLSLNNIGYINDNSYYPIQRVIFTNIDKGKTENNVDLAVIILDKESALELKQKYEFIQRQDLALNHILVPESRYHIYGYPAEWTDLNTSNKTLNIKPFQFVTTGIIHHSIADIQYSRKYNILVSYNRDKMIYTKSGEHIEDFTPNGISGCGLWFYNGGCCVKLIGIMIEDKWIKSKQPFMMATRIDEVLKIIQTYNPKTD